MQGADLFIVGAKAVPGQQFLLGADMVQCLFQIFDLLVPVFDCLQGLLVVAGHGFI